MTVTCPNVSPHYNLVPMTHTLFTWYPPDRHLFNRQNYFWPFIILLMDPPAKLPESPLLFLYFNVSGMCDGLGISKLDIDFVGPAGVKLMDFMHLTRG